MLVVFLVDSVVEQSPQNFRPYPVTGQPAQMSTPRSACKEGAVGQKERGMHPGLSSASVFATS